MVCRAQASLKSTATRSFTHIGGTAHGELTFWSSEVVLVRWTVEDDFKVKVALAAIQGDETVAEFGEPPSDSPEHDPKVEAHGAR